MDVVSEELRQQPRRKIEHPAFINIAIQSASSDLSRFKTRLAVDDPAGLPDEFMLEITGDLCGWCRIIWRSEKKSALNASRCGKVGI